MKSSRRPKKGFTLIELLVAVVVIGMLAAMGIPTYLKVTRNSRAAAVANDINTLANASETYIMESGQWPPDTTAGTFPNEMAGYFAKRFFESNTPMGGQWDFEQFDSGVTSAVGVVSPSLPEEEFVKVDSLIDDGNLATGQFRKIADERYFWVIAE